MFRFLIEAAISLASVTRIKSKYNSAAARLAAVLYYFKYLDLGENVMATLLLSRVSSNIRGVLTKGFNKFFKRKLRGTARHWLEETLDFGEQTLPRSSLENIYLQTSTYGKSIPLAYGINRIAGNIIWALPVKEISKVNAPYKGKRYAYEVTLAIGICKGVVNELLNIWANGTQLNLDSLVYRFYSGSESQLPDPLIAMYEKFVTAYRGLSYVVIENFNISDYKGRIPNFTFEISVTPEVIDNQATVQNRVLGINIIPGSGEFVCDPQLQLKLRKIDNENVPFGTVSRINQNSYFDVTDAVFSTMQLRHSLPNLKWVSVVVNWFANSLDISDCEIYPAVEFKYGALTSPDAWSVGAIDRAHAKEISHDNQGNLRYGGTINDSSLLRYIKLLKSQGYKVVLYPMILLDLEGKPWRGYITGSSADVTQFFKIQYNPFIMHYCELARDAQVDAFIIGSELVGLTRITDDQKKYPAVDELINLAMQVKLKLSSSVTVTYAADWSEYHSHNGYYNLDKLWASAAIDVVGIDAYFPLTDAIQPISGFTKQDIIAGWNSGEGYDYYYTDPLNRQGKTPYTDSKYAWKNIDKWWSEAHTNPDDSTTPWQPAMKKIWFTEFGFPSVDGCSNQPNVFIDQSSSESQYPYYSRGEVDFYAQKIAIDGTLAKWDGSAMVTNLLLWTWDSRPFPSFPNLVKTWADGNNWQTGHWVQGKISMLELRDVIFDLCRRAGFTDDQIDITELRGLLLGYVIDHQQILRKSIETLQDAYFFDLVEQDEKLVFTSRGGEPKLTIADVELVTQEKAYPLTVIVDAHDIIPQKIDVLYLDKLHNYQQNTRYAKKIKRAKEKNTDIAKLVLPLVLMKSQARNIAEISLYGAWTERESYSFILPISYIFLSPGDLLTVTSADNKKYPMQITAMNLREMLIEINAVAYNEQIYRSSFPPEKIVSRYAARSNQLSESAISIFDLPCLNEQPSTVYCAIRGLEENWRGAILLRSKDNGHSYDNINFIEIQSVTGFTLNELAYGPTATFDEGSELIIVFNNDKLESADELAVLNGKNLALVGDEVIQFVEVEDLGHSKYKLRKFLRAKYGTEQENHKIGEAFTLLDNRVLPIIIDNADIGRPYIYKAVSYGSLISDAAEYIFQYSGRNLQPLPVVHISGQRNESADLQVSWIRCARLDSQWRDYVDVPLDDRFERYEIDILNADNQVIRTATVENQTSFTYSASKQKEDFGDVQNVIKMAIYQISSFIGRGRAAQAVL